MAAYTASVSAITYNSITFEAVGSMAVSMSRQPIDITQVGSANSNFLSGILTTAIALDIYYNKADHVTFTTALLTPASNAFTFTTAASDVVTGNGFVTGCDIVATMGDIVRGSITIQCTGIVSVNATAAASGGNES